MISRVMAGAIHLDDDRCSSRSRGGPDAPAALCGGGTIPSYHASQFRFMHVIHEHTTAYKMHTVLRGRLPWLNESDEAISVSVTTVSHVSESTVEVQRAVPRIDVSSDHVVGFSWFYVFRYFGTRRAPAAPAPAATQFAITVRLKRAFETRRHSAAIHVAIPHTRPHAIGSNLGTLSLTSNS